MRDRCCVRGRTAALAAVRERQGQAGPLGETPRVVDSHQRRVGRFLPVLHGWPTRESRQVYPPRPAAVTGQWASNRRQVPVGNGGAPRTDQDSVA